MKVTFDSILIFISNSEDVQVVMKIRITRSTKKTRQGKPPMMNPILAPQRPMTMADCKKVTRLFFFLLISLAPMGLFMQIKFAMHAFLLYSYF